MAYSSTARMIVAATVTLAVVVAIWGFIAMRSAAPPPPKVVMPGATPAR